MPSSSAIRLIAPFDLAGSARAYSVILVARSRSSSGYFLCPMRSDPSCHHCLHQTRGATLSVTGSGSGTTTARIDGTGQGTTTTRTVGPGNHHLTVTDTAGHPYLSWSDPAGTCH